MRATLVLVSILSLAACSKAANEADSGQGSYDLAQTNADGPGVAVTTAPGVAFNYHYAFRLPPARISAAQEAHAQACEKLGILHCRITGMRYTLLGDDRIAASLAFKLDPTIARAFGKQASRRSTPPTACSSTPRSPAPMPAPRSAARSSNSAT